MGNKIITFTHEQLDHYQDCTFFNKKEILKVFKKFRNLAPEIIPMEMTTLDAVKIKVPKERIVRLPELLENPFAERVCESFSKDGYGNLNFEEFLDCLSVFSEHAPRDLKIYYAFRIYDYDGDEFISESDIRQVLKNLTKNELTNDEQQKITEKIIEEGDIDNENLKSTHKRKGFHAKYLSICKAKNIQPLPEVKAKQKNIHVVEFHADRVRINDWLAICGALEKDRSLKSLAIRLRKNDGMVFEDIDTAKKTKAIISHPVIYSKFVFMELLNALQSFLTHNNQLEVLVLEGLPIYGRYMTHLVKGLCTNRSIKILSFARSNICDEACEILCSNIKHLTNIESVNLSHCNLGVKGATAVRDFIRYQKIHRFSEAWTRSLRYQNIDAASFDGVKKINLNNNPQIGDAGLEILTDELGEDVWIKELEMQNCGLTDAGVIHITNCLQINKTILNFCVSNNHEISEHLIRHVMSLFGSGSGTAESSISSETKSLKINKSQLIDNIKFLEDQLETEVFRRKELEKSFENLHKQMIENQKEMTSLQIPDGFTLLPNEAIAKMITKKPSVIAHKTNSLVRLRRKKVVRKVRSFIFENPQNNLSKSKSENVIKDEVKQKRIFVEKNIGDSVEIGNNVEENSMSGVELLRCFTKRKQANKINDCDPRTLFERRGLIVPSNSDADSDN